MRLSWIDCRCAAIAATKVTDRTAVLGREVAAQIVVINFVVLSAVEETDRARQVRAAVRKDAVVGDAQVVVLVVRHCRCGHGRLGVPMRMAP